MAENIRIAIDAMGGDYAPEEIVKGALEALAETPELSITLVGQKEKIEAVLKGTTCSEQLVPENGTSCSEQVVPRLTIEDAREVIEMAEAPVKAVTTKKDSSLVRCMRMVKDGSCDAMISAGSTGAVLAGGQLIVGRIKGIERPAFGPILPTAQGPALLIDCGANMDARPTQLVQFAQMGSIYMESIVGIKNPRVALVNVGTEEEKGNALVKETFPLLKNLENINFIGNIEAIEIPAGGADVIVCDAFVGNVILKMYEGVASVLLKEIKSSLMGSLTGKIGGALIKGSLKGVLKKYDSSGNGGAALLGLTGLVVKAHGNAKARDILLAIDQCIRYKEQNLEAQFKDKMKLVDRTKKEQPSAE